MALNFAPGTFPFPFLSCRYFNIHDCNLCSENFIPFKVTCFSIDKILVEDFSTTKRPINPKQINTPTICSFHSGNFSRLVPFGPISKRYV